jgi:glycosyltransferase involved in cell wall biosynthesis
MTVTHILSSFTTPTGADQRAISMAIRLSKTNSVTLWSRKIPNHEFQQYGVRQIRPYSGEHPNGGTLYICNPNIPVGHWYDESKFDRIVLVHNLCDQELLYRAMHRLTLSGKRQIEIIYASELVKKYIGLDGEIEYPFDPIDIQPARSTIGNQNARNTFTVGRISRDTKLKHHPHDIKLYKALAAAGIRVKVVGGTCLRPWLSESSMIELIPEIPHSAVPSMLKSFDCFYYRTSRYWHEAFGMEIVEAVQAELPVIAYDDGGYVDWLRSQQKSFLFTTNEEAFLIIQNMALQKCKAITRSN